MKEYISSSLSCIINYDSKVPETEYKLWRLLCDVDYSQLFEALDYDILNLLAVISLKISNGSIDFNRYKYFIFSTSVIINNNLHNLRIFLDL